MLDTSVFRTLLVSSLVGTVIGNRTALLRHVQMKQYNFKHFVVLVSLSINQKGVSVLVFLVPMPSLSYCPRPKSSDSPAESLRD